MYEEGRVERTITPAKRFLILKYLILNGEANITKISRDLGLSYPITKNHLEELLKLGIIKERRLGRVRIFQINYDDSLVRKIARFVMESLNHT